MKTMKWGLAAAGLIAAIGVIGYAVLGGGGTARADEGADGNLSGVPNYQDLLAPLGITPAQLATEQKAALAASVDDAVAAGKITPDQGASLKDATAAGKGHGKGGLHSRLKAAVNGIIDAAARTIGISKDDLKSNLKQGKSLAQIAADHNVSRQQLESGITSDVQTQLQTAVTSGKLTQQQADRVSAGLSKHIDKLVDRTRGPGRKNK